MAINSYTMRPLTALEVTAMNGYTHKGVITAADLTNTTNAGTQALTLGPIPKGSKAQILIDPLVPFKDADTPTTDLTTVSFGDAGSATSLLTAQELNVFGTEITNPVEGTLSTVYAADGTLLATFTPKAGTNLNQIDVGELVYYFRLVNPIPHVNASVTTMAGALK